MSTLINLTPETPWSFRDQPIVVGKDILEVLSNAMYVDPLAIYREYIQNAADAIDEARRTGILSPRATGRNARDWKPTSRRPSKRWERLRTRPHSQKPDLF
jgi:hypothetical protein